MAFSPIFHAFWAFFYITITEWWVFPSSLTGCFFGKKNYWLIQWLGFLNPFLIPSCRPGVFFIGQIKCRPGVGAMCQPVCAWVGLQSGWKSDKSKIGRSWGEEKAWKRPCYSRKQREQKEAKIEEEFAIISWTKACPHDIGGISAVALIFVK